MKKTSLRTENNLKNGIALLRKVEICHIYNIKQMYLNIGLIQKFRDMRLVIFIGLIT